jgi:hypothetical protein
MLNRRPGQAVVHRSAQMIPSQPAELEFNRL